MAIDDYITNDEGIITSPGKFEGQPHWLAGFYEYALQSCDDGHERLPDGTLVSVFLITSEDRRVFPMFPSDKSRLHLWTDEQGFVHHELF